MHEFAERVGKILERVEKILERWMGKSHAPADVWICMRMETKAVNKQERFKCNWTADCHHQPKIIKTSYHTLCVSTSHCTYIFFVTEGIVTEDVVNEGIVTEGIVTEGIVTEGIVTEGVVTEGTVTEGIEPLISIYRQHRPSPQWLSAPKDNIININLTFQARGAIIILLGWTPLTSPPPP